MKKSFGEKMEEKNGELELKEDAMRGEKERGEKGEILGQQLKTEKEELEAAKAALEAAGSGAEVTASQNTVPNADIYASNTEQSEVLENGKKGSKTSASSSSSSSSNSSADSETITSLKKQVEDLENQNKLLVKEKDDLNKEVENVIED